MVMTSRGTDLELILLITQLIFAGTILTQYIKLEILRFRVGRVYDELYNHFLRGEVADQALNIATILDNVVSYESAKAAATIKLSSKIFHKLNNTLTSEWDDIRRRLKIDT